MNLNGDFEVQGEDDVVPVVEPDLPVNEENQLVDPVDQNTVVAPVEEFTEEVVLSEVPEVEEDIKGIAALESALVELSYVAQDILKAGGMNQTIALEADRCIEGFLYEDRPLGFYTKTPTATNLKYALEAIDLKKAGIIGAIIAATLAVIYKIYKYFTNSPAEGGGPMGGKSKKDTDDFAEKVAERAKHYQDTYGDLSKKVQGGTDNLMSDVAKECPATKRILKEMDGLTFDLLSNRSVMLDKVESFIISNNGARGLKILLSNMMTAVDSIYETAKKQAGSYMVVDQAEAKPQIKKLKEGTHPILSEQLNSLKYEGKLVSITEIRHDLRSTINDLSAQSKPIGKYSEAAKNLQNLLNMKLIDEYAAMAEEFTSSLEEFKEKIEKLSKLVTTKTHDTGNRVIEVKSYDGEKELMQALKVLSRMHADLSDILTVIYKVLVMEPAKIVGKFQTSLKEAKDYLHRVQYEYKTTGRGESHPEELKRIEEMIEAFKDIK